MIDCDKLREVLAPGDPQEWQEHDGKGRPHPPGSYVEMEFADGSTEKGPSAAYSWVWENLPPTYVKPDPVNIVRWRYAKRPPTDRELAAYVPGLLAMLDARNAA